VVREISSFFLLYILDRSIRFRLFKPTVEQQKNGNGIKTDIKTTMIYTHVLNRGGAGVRSHLDALWSVFYTETI